MENQESRFYFCIGRQKGGCAKESSILKKLFLILFSKGRIYFYEKINNFDTQKLHLLFFIVILWKIKASSGLLE